MLEKSQLLLIDGNGLLYRAFHAYPVLTTSSGEQVNAVYGFAVMLLHILTTFHPAYIAFVFDAGVPTFRHHSFTQYKAQRKPMDDVLVAQLDRVYELVRAFRISIYSLEGYEADDLIGTIVRQSLEGIELGTVRLDEVVIVTGDHDLLQLLQSAVCVYMPGKNFSNGRVIDVETFRTEYGLDHPRQLIDFKALCGDASDNIPGVAGIGKVGAQKLLHQYGTLENIYAHLDDIDEKIRHKLVESAEMAFLSKKLATIDTNVPFTFHLDSCFYGTVDTDSISRFFQELGFKSLMKRLEVFARKHTVCETPQFYSGGFHYESPLSVDDEKEALRVYLRDQPEAIVALDIAMVDVLRRMKEHGVLVDVAVLENLSKEFEQKIAECSQSIFSLVGYEFNLNSPKQLGEVLFDHLQLPVLKRTKTGRSTDEEVLQELALTHDVAQKVLEYRELFKLKSTYLDGLPKYIASDHRIHSTFKLDVTATGRLSSSEPNLQNIPIRGHWGSVIRRAFVAPDGFLLLACDYSQIELRILAHLSNDERMKAVFVDGRDIHTSTAAFIFNTPYDQVTKDQRRSAKTINFGLMYGMGSHALARELRITFAEAQSIIQTYFASFPQVKAWIDKTIEKGRTLGYVETVLGRRRYLPELQSRNQRLRSAGERMAVNMPAQGTQAEMIKLAMVALDKDICERGQDDIALILQIHDELIFEVKEAVLPLWRDIVVDRMRHALPLSVPIEVGVTVGKNWGDMK